MPIRNTVTSDANPAKGFAARTPGSHARSTTTISPVTPTGIASEIHSTVPAAAVARTAAAGLGRPAGDGASRIAPYAAKATSTAHVRHRISFIGRARNTVIYLHE